MSILVADILKNIIINQSDFSMKISEYLAFGLGLIILSFTIFSILKYVNTLAEDIIKINAIVKDKRYESVEDNDSITYLVKFLLDDGQEFIAEVDSQKYSELSIDDAGILTYQGEEFKSFEVIK